MAEGKILVVEDEAKIAEIEKAYLEREGHSVSVAKTGEEAMRLLKDGFDLIVLDLMLPDMDGEDLCRLIRENSDVPIIMLTAKSGEEERIKGLGLGADDYVTKPFSPRELVARVNAHLRRSMKQSGLISFNNGALTIDGQSREVKVKGKPVSLTPTEFRILGALSENPSLVMSRQQLVNLVSGYDFEGYERTVDAHIKNLRQKIEEDPRNPVFIKTVYGVGYKFGGQRDEAK